MTSTRQQHYPKSGLLSLDSTGLIDSQCYYWMPSLTSFIATATISRDAWSILVSTYAISFRGCIFHLRGQLDRLSLANQTTYIQIYANGKALLMNYLSWGRWSTLRILLLRCSMAFLTPTRTSPTLFVFIRPLSFYELHKKHITCEALLYETNPKTSPLPTTANTKTKPFSRPTNPNGNCNSLQPDNNCCPSCSNTNTPDNSNHTNISRPYLGHIAKRCPTLSTFTAHT